MIKYIILFISFLLLFNKENLFAQSIDLNNLSATLKKAKFKDTIYIKSGIYRDVITKINYINDKELVIRPKSKGEVIIEGNSTFIVKNSSRIKFEGFLFKETENSAFIISNSSKIIIHDNYFDECGSYPTHSLIRMVNKVFDNEVSFNTFDKSGAMCIAIFTKNESPIDSLNKNNLIYRNVFKNTPAVTTLYPKAKTTNGMEAIMLGTGYGKTLDYQLDNKIIENIFINIIGDRQEIISNKSSGNKIIRNSFINNLSGLSVRSGNNVVIKDNYFKSTKRGIRVFGENHIIENNFIENSDFALRLPKTNSSKVSSNYLEKGYQQQQNICFTKNIIFNVAKEAIHYNEGNLMYSAQNIAIENNKFFLKSEQFLTKERFNKEIIKKNNAIFQLLDSNAIYTNWISDFENYKSFKTEKDKGCRWYK